jgi:glycerate 2-kinase
MAGESWVTFHMPSVAPRSVLIAPDKFKGTLDAHEASLAIEAGLKRVWPHTNFRRLPLSDGGEGFVAAYLAAGGGELVRFPTVDACGRPCEAVWGRSSDGTTAIVELASASGLAQIPESLRDPMRTSTWGTGLLLAELMERGFSTLVVGLGGSATNDAGMGLAAGLGFRFLDTHGHPVPMCGGGLRHVASIQKPNRPLKARIIAATDVDNPLYGPTGAAHQFAAQKGATPAQVEELDRGLRHFAAVVAATVGVDFSSRPGAGAAGGCGFGLMALLAAERCSGFDLIAAKVGLEREVRRHELVVTGEGSFDRTSLAGKGPARLAAVAATHDVPVWGVFGRTEAESSLFHRVGQLDPIDASQLAQLSKETHFERLATAAERLAQS